MNDSFWNSFREEVLATSMILVLMVIATFFLAGRLFPSTDEPEELVEVDRKEVLAAQINEAVSAIDGSVQDTDEPENDLQASPIPTQAPTLTPLDTEVAYGLEGQYVFDDYELILGNPRIAFNLQNADSKRFVVNVQMKNISLTQGLPTALKVEIIKDGTIIVPEAAMSVTENKILSQGESATFEASISLIDGTDVRRLLFEPLGAGKQVDHVLNPENDEEI